MPVHPRVARWINDNYRRPRIDPEWLEECYAHLVGELHLNPDTEFDRFTESLEWEILGSNLNDSMLPGTGLPTHIAQQTTTAVLGGPPVLVEVVLLTEIGESAFNLNQTRITREERSKDATVYDAEDEQDVDPDVEGPMPKYSRGMLKLQLSDGTTLLPAIEYRPLPELSLEDTPLGYKILLRDVMIRRGIAFLEAKTVVLLGGRTEDRDEHRKVDFARGLRARMGLPEPQAEQAAQNDQVYSAQPAQQPPQQPQNIRSPLREISPPPAPLARYRNDDEDLDTRRRRIPNRAHDPTPAASSSTLVASNLTRKRTATTSSYFTTTSTSDIHSGTNGRTAIDLVLSPNRATTRPILSPPFAASRETEIGLSFPEAMPVPRPLFIDSPPPSPDPDEEQFWSIPRHDQPPPLWSENTARSVGEMIHFSADHASQQGKGKERDFQEGYGSDDFGDDDMFAQIDDETLEKLDAVEKEAYASGPSQSTTLCQSSSTRSEARRPDGSMSQIVEVITIDDDEEDGDDKENFPVPTRHVRRRIEENGVGGSSGGRTQRARQPNRSVVPAQAVIDISDSD